MIVDTIYLDLPGQTVGVGAAAGFSLSATRPILPLRLRGPPVKSLGDRRKTSYAFCSRCGSILLKSELLYPTGRLARHLCMAVLTVVAWVVTGPMFHYSDGWQLVINTGTTVVTFLMVFLLQQRQNKDSVALHLKLNELLSSHRAASNQLIGIEDASEDELRRLAAAYLRLSTKRTYEVASPTPEQLSPAEPVQTAPDGG
ncbi:Low affinity iron permease [Caballeronia arvi]|uniref:Low affinity iron permease n=1 Tax=Caballeronia arvi TaxID=1777135 RepID=A0A158L571_9BURK|nr:Low affinity iron permease [Caballeronia arvi]